MHIAKTDFELVFFSFTLYC